MLLVALVPLASAASDFPMQAVLEVDRVETGPDASLQGEVLLLGVPAVGAKGLRIDRLTVQADQVDVVIVAQTVRHVGGILVVPEHGGAEQRVHRHEAGTAHVVPRGHETWLVSTGLESGKTFQATGRLPAATFDTLDSALFRSWEQTFRLPEDIQTEPRHFETGMDVRNVRAHMAEAGGSWTLEGDLRIVLYDFSVRVTDDERTTTYETGMVRVADQGVPGVESYEDRRAELVLRNATVHYESSGRPVTFHMVQAELGLVGGVVLEQATGTITTGDAQHRLMGARVELMLREGILGLAPGTEDAPRFSAALEGTAMRVVADGDALLASEGSHGLWPFDGALVRGAVAIVALVLAILLIVSVGQNLRAQEEGPGLLRAEASYASGRYRRACRHARRVLAKNPRNNGAALLESMALLKRGRPDRLVRRLGSRLEEGHDDTGVLALLASIAYFRMGDENRGRHCFHLAMAHNPGLLRELRGTDLLAQVRKNFSSAQYLKWDEYMSSYG